MYWFLEIYTVNRKFVMFKLFPCMTQTRALAQTYICTNIQKKWQGHLTTIGGPWYSHNYWDLEI